MEAKDPVTIDEMKENIHRSMRDMLEQSGLTDEYLIGKLKEELDAKETKIFAYQGEIGDEKDLVAWEIRQRARQDAHKLRGDYPAEEHRFSGEVITPRSPEEQQTLQEIAKSVAQAIRDKKTKCL